MTPYKDKPHNSQFWTSILDSFEYKEISDFPLNAFGFVYKIVNKTNGKIYIGKKQLYHTSKVKIGKEEKERNKKNNIWKDYKYVTKESDWKKYYGSSKLLKEDIQKLGNENFERWILKICYNSKELNYWETYYQFFEQVLIRDSYCDNIAGRYFRKDFE